MEEDSNHPFHHLDFSRSYSDEVQVPFETSSKSSPKNENLLHELNQLTIAKERFKLFLEELGDLKRTPIRTDIILYCGEQKKS
jgi:hypothetical protein